MGLGVLLAGRALVLLFDGGWRCLRLFSETERLRPGVIELLDRTFLMIVEIMHTVQVNFDPDCQRVGQRPDRGRLPPERLGVGAARMSTWILFVVA